MYTLNDMLRHCGAGGDPIAKNNIIRGLLLQKMLELPAHAGQPLAAQLDEIDSAIEGGRLALYFDRHGAFGAYAYWARPAAGGQAGAQRVWLSSFWAARPVLRAVLAHLRDEALADAAEVSYFRHKPAGRIAKCLTRKRRHSFFRQRAG